MGRANNVGRSLIILSKMQGWDPCTIEGADYPSNEYNEDKVTKGSDTRFTGHETDPQGPTPDPAVPGPDNRSPGPGGKNHGVGDPYGPGNMEG